MYLGPKAPVCTGANGPYYAAAWTNGCYYAELLCYCCDHGGVHAEGVQFRLLVSARCICSATKIIVADGTLVITAAYIAGTQRATGQQQHTEQLGGHRGLCPPGSRGLKPLQGLRGVITP